MKQRGENRYTILETAALPPVLLWLRYGRGGGEVIHDSEERVRDLERRF